MRWKRSRNISVQLRHKDAVASDGVHLPDNTEDLIRQQIRTTQTAVGHRANIQPLFIVERQWFHL